MLKLLQLQQLRSELAAAKELLEQSKAEDDFVGEVQYANRVKQLTVAISRIDSHKDERARVALFFGGAPVIGSRAISAEFSGKVLKYFQDLVAKDFARSAFGDLAQTGPIPAPTLNQLMITGVALGSFGFTMEEISDQEEMLPTRLKDAVESVADKLSSITAEDESKFVQALDTIGSRELVTWKKLFSVLNSSQATMRVAEDDSELYFDEIAIQRGRDRVERAAIDEQSETIVCELLGVLPEHKRYEARLQDGTVIMGPLSTEGIRDFEAQQSRVALDFPAWWALRFVVRKITSVNLDQKISYTLVGFDHQTHRPALR